MRILILLAVSLAALGCGSYTKTEVVPIPDDAPADPPADFDGTVIPTDGGTWVAARLVKAEGESKGVVLMFHQAGSNMHEYDPIAERVAKLGWDCLKVDLRAGGDMWGEQNLTATQFNDSQLYLEAYKDMDAALAWAEGAEYKRILAWGSSYSASLVLKLAAENPVIEGVVSFSPGEYFDQPGLVAGWNSSVKVPRFFAATSQEINGGVLAIYQAAEDLKLQRMIGYSNGVHGSSTLREDTCPERFETYWEGVEGFFQMLDGEEPKAP